MARARKPALLELAQLFRISDDSLRYRRNIQKIELIFVQVYKTSEMLLTKECLGVIILPYFNKVKAMTKTVEHPALQRADGWCESVSGRSGPITSEPEAGTRK